MKFLVFVHSIKQCVIPTRPVNSARDDLISLLKHFNGKLPCLKSLGNYSSGGHGPFKKKDSFIVSCKWSSYF